MKTQYLKDIFKIDKFGLTILLLFFGFFLHAQVDEEVKDSVKTGVDLGHLQLGNPQSITEAYTYDPASDRYIYTKTFDGFNINYPIILTPREYEELLTRESMRDYFQKKLDAIDGKKAGAEEAKKDLLPRYYVNSGLFETIFGGNTIDVKPTGSVEMDLGIRFTKQDNPSFSPRNRKSLTFDFDQRISLSLQGKVGTRLMVNANYDTQSTFAFQNLIKLEYTPTEDDIIKKIEVGNVSFPLNSSLIRGAQSLFGAKMQLQFGKTTITGVFSEQKSQTKSVTAQGGGTLQDFELFALDYDTDRHYFLSQYFRNKYDEAMKTYPIISSRAQITRIEVWITNKQNRINTADNNLRNIIALQDLGEGQLTDADGVDITASTVGVHNQGLANFYNGSQFNNPSDNSNNLFDPALIGIAPGLLNGAIRDVATASNGFNAPVAAIEGKDYTKLENARKLSPSDYTYHPQLGYISLNQRLANDEVLAVAYQYTIGDKIYQVGEFGTDGVDATDVSSGIPTTQSLVLKMLKSNLNNIDQPVWNLMMKNIYQIPGAYQLSREDFRFNIVYTDPSPLNYINLVAPLPSPDLVTSTPLLKVFNLDKLNYTNDPQEGGDGFFDFIPGMTIDPQNGRIIFTTVEPFGKLLFNKLRTSPFEDYNEANTTNTFNDNQKKYVFRNLYKKTQALALQDSEKNKFQLKGKFKSTGGDGISIGAFNVPQGSVVVSAGGRVLVEGVDYTVDYQRGRVQILDPSLSTTPIEVSVENNSVFGQQTRRFYGLNVEHKFSDKFQLSGTFLRMSEKPFTQKSNYGQESVNNTIVGLNGNFSTEVPFFTRMVNKLPNLDTDVPSNLSFRGEIAYLMPGNSKNDRFNGESTIYIDDFEGSQSTIDMRAPQAWSLASTPLEGNLDGVPGEATPPSDDLSVGYKRAKLSWYTVDPIFYVDSQRPDGISEADLRSNRVRRIYSDELYPNTDIAQGQTTVVSTLDMTYYPTERGPYNFSPLANPVTNALANPTDNWGGIMRSINSTNFEQSNVEYIQFWMMDPYYGQNPEDTTPVTNTGKLTINLGEISEDILNDGRKLYENGLPEVGSTLPTYTTNWGKIPAAQSLIYAFDSNEGNRAVQDLGFNGLSDAEEAVKYPTFAASSDPAADNYQYYLSAGGNVIERYKNYNGVEGNSPVSLSDTNRGSSTLPDVEDINRDNTMNTINAYYKFEIPITPNPVIGQNYVVDTRVNDAVPIANGTTKVRWVLYKIPILEATAANTVGSISDFRSIRFMRMFLSDFQEELTLRFGSLDLVRGEWRRFLSSMDNNDPDVTDDNTGFDVTALNIQENGSRSPIPYVMPPGVQREQLNNNNSIINQNEQSLSLRVYSKDGSPSGGLEEKDARAVFKNVSVDMRQFKKLRMFLHAESLETSTDLQNNEMVGFIRFGNDFTQNFYEIQIPLKPTAFGETDPAKIWPVANEIDLSLSLLTQLKILALQNNLPPDDDLTDGIQFVNEDYLDGSLAGKENLLRVGVKGNPNFGLVRTLMVGVRNRTNPGKTIRGEVWFNELRMSDMDNKGGWAAVANMDTNFADFANVSATGRKSTIGFGGLEEGPNERSREDVFQYNVVSNVNVGKLLPKKWGITIPFNYAVGEETITPKFDPFYQDIELQQLLDVTQDEAEKKNIKNRAIDYTKRTSINFIGVKKERSQDQKQHFYDPENLTLSHSFNEMQHHDFQIQSLVDQQVKSSADYAFAFKPKSVEPFKNTKFMKKSSYWKMLSDFNFSYLPSTISFSTNVLRQYNRQEFRQVDVEGIGLDPLYRRNYLFNYNYGFNYNLTKALRFNYTVATNNIVRNYFDENKRPIDELTIWDDYFNIGEANMHTQQLVVNYDLPINKIPALSFIKSSYSYTSDYSWQRSSDALSSIDYNGVNYSLGNTIQNAGSHKLNTTFNMDMLYRYVGITNKTKKQPGGNVKPAAPKPGQKLAAAPTNVANERGLLTERLIGLATSLKTLQMNYTQNEGTMLPGYLQRVGFLGTSKPTVGFVLGSQADVRYEAAKNGWLTYYPEFNQNFTQVKNKTLNVTGQLELFPDFKIDITADRVLSENYSEQYDVSADGQYNSRSPYNYGNYSMSTVLIKTAFSQSDENMSAAFNDFRNNRLIVANRLAIGRGIDINNPANIDADGFPKGYGKNSQAVLLPAFYAAYTGTDASNVKTGPFRDVPIPNWNVKYTGLMRYQWFKDNFKRFSLQHGYRASYTINSFRSNFEYDRNPDPVVASGTVNYPVKTIISNVNLVEQFNPLVRLDFEMKNSFKILAEMKKDRALSLSFDNNLLTEVKGNEYIVGLGYRVKDVIFSTILAEDPSGVIKSDLNLKADVSFRNNKTIVRYLDYDNNQLGGGQNIWSIKFTADYSFSKNLTAIFYYDHSFSKAVISTTFPITNIRSGFTLRYNFGN
ncbi:gliding motility-related protein [Flavobacterium cauense R2A-7]|uniref:Protein involved in gliding motility SprA n=1 Tax=Flavobacterium cauense R2A-7 TaxID=1341154 RepID=V6S1A4_9FLAO|nr:gliding motility-related protein [Flavobacterium cauense R2A-7]TWI14805.1 protein involved in gliding motility SprA [Flavobacterium cauense R2A-7]